MKDVGPEDNLVSYLPQDDDDDSDLSDNGRNDVEVRGQSSSPIPVLNCVVFSALHGMIAIVLLTVESLSAGRCSRAKTSYCWHC